VAAIFKPPERVREIAAPHRTGTVRAVRGSGSNAIVVVNLDGRAPQNFRPAQIEHA
jgi:hypothetical protein